MASAQVIVLAHLVGAGLGLALVVSAARSLARRPRIRVRTEDATPPKRHLRPLARCIGQLLGGTVRLALTLTLVLVTPLGLLWANRRYPLVAPVLAPFEARLRALGHRPAHACCLPLLTWRVWRVRCAGCHRHSFFREVPAAGGRGIELKALGTDVWRTRPCPAEYLTAPSAQTARSSQPVHPLRRQARTRPARRVQPSRAVSPALPQPPATEKTA